MRRFLTFIIAIMLAFVPIGVGLSEAPATPTDIDETIPIVETIEQIEEMPDEQIIDELQVEENNEEKQENDIEEIIEPEIVEEPIEEVLPDEPAEETIEEVIEEPIERSVKLYASWENQEHVYLGDEITLWFVTEGFDNIDYTIQWEYSENGIDFFAIENAHDITYKFIINEINCNYYWRVKLITID